MYIAHPTHGAGTRPNRTQPPTAARKTTLDAGQCVRQPGKAEGGTGSPPPQKKTEGGGGGETAHSHQTARQHHQRRPTPPPEGTEDRTPEQARGDDPAKTAKPSQVQRPTGKRDTGTCRHTPRRKNEKTRASSPARKEWGWGDRDHKARDRDTQQKKKSRKKHTPTTQPRRAGHSPDPGPARTPTPHAGTGNGGGQARCARNHITSNKQAETEPQPRTPQTADTRGTTPRTVPKHTHPRPQPGLAGLTKPTPNRKPDLNANAAQQ